MELRTPLTIGSLRLDRRLFMAPMAGITTAPFRRSVRRWGAGLVFTEMISSHGVHYGNRRTVQYLACGADEHPIGFQLFGADPAIMATAAEACLAAGADLVDINMACPVRKVVKTGAGAALLGEPATAVAIVRAVAAAVAGAAPVSVKIRAGLHAGDRLGVDIAHRLAEAGAAAVCIHPRYASQLYRGAADHALTRELCRVLPVPVIASGDVDGRPACEALLVAGAAAAMVARAAVGRPWVFTEILEPAACITPPERLKEVRRFVDEVVAGRGPRALGYLRQFWPRFRRHGALDRDVANRLMAARDVTELRSLLA